MSEQYKTDMSGALFRNERKETDKQPDYRGDCEVDGVKYWVAGWLKKSKAGKAYMSLAFTAKDQHGQQGQMGRREERPTRQQQHETSPPSDPGMDMDSGDIPF